MPDLLCAFENRHNSSETGRLVARREAIHRSSRAPNGRQLAAHALRTALALDHLFRALAAIGVYVYEPRAQICGVTGYGPADTVQVTGMRWLAGAKVDDAPPTIREVHAFLAEVL